MIAIVDKDVDIPYSQVLAERSVGHDISKNMRGD